MIFMEWPGIEIEWYGQISPANYINQKMKTSFDRDSQTIRTNVNFAHPIDQNMINIWLDKRKDMRLIFWLTEIDWLLTDAKPINHTSITLWVREIYKLNCYVYPTSISNWL